VNIAGGKLLVLGANVDHNFKKPISGKL